jgi:serine protease Do
VRNTISPALLAGLLLLAAPSLQAQTSPRSADRPWMGVSIRDMADEDHESLALPANVRGVVVEGVDADGPAARAGVEPADVVVQLDGANVRDREDLLRRLETKHPGDTVRLTVVRDSKRKTLKVVLAPRPRERDESWGFPDHEFHFAHESSGAQLGVMTADLDDADLAAVFGVQPGFGVLVTGVTAGSGAEKAGIKGGDVLVAVAGDELHGVDDLRQKLGDYAAGDTVEVRLRRRNQQQTVKVELGESRYAFRMPRVMRFHGDEVDDLQRELRDLRRELQDLQRELHSKHE